MDRTSARTWRAARDIADLGRAMADWLEGSLSSRPGYFPGAGPDEETLPLVPVLAAACRAGFATTASQPGLTETAFGGRPWTQRAAVQGYVAAGDPLLPRLADAVGAADLIVTAYDAGWSRGPEEGVVVTRWGDDEHTGFGGRSGRIQRSLEWTGAGRDARRAVRREGVALAVVDPVWGRNTVLWSLLAGVVNGRI